MYLLFVLIAFCTFIFWVVQEGWYDRINTLHQTESDLDSWANYLEKISDDFKDPKKSVEPLIEATQIRNRLDQPVKALKTLEKALAIDPENNALKSQILPLYMKSGQKNKAVQLAKENLKAGQRDAGTFTVLLESIAEQPDPDLASKLVQAILGTDLPQKQIFADGNITALGLTADRWTTDGNCGFLIVSGNIQSFSVSCYAELQYLPINTTVEDQFGNQIFSHTFKSKENVRVELPDIPAESNRLFIIKTDKTWIRPQDLKRKLGVRITPQTLK